VDLRSSRIISNAMIDRRRRLLSRNFLSDAAQSALIFSEVTVLGRILKRGGRQNYSSKPQLACSSLSTGYCRITQCRSTARAPPRCSTQRAGFAPPHAEGDRLSGVTSNRDSFAFISGPAAFVGGVPLTRAMIPWPMPAAST